MTIWPQMSLPLAEDCTYTLTSPYQVNGDSSDYPYDADGYGPVGLPPISTIITIIGNGATIERSSGSNFRWWGCLLLLRQRWNC